MIYLDHNATSPTRPEVVAALLPYLTERGGNPSSVHGAGRAARQGMDEARRLVAGLLGVHESQVVFGSGGTEANNTAILGVAARCGFTGRLLVSAVEHSSVLAACEVARARGMSVVTLPVDGQGRVDPQAVADALAPGAALVSVMHANNETGVVQPVVEIAALCRRAGVPLHVDAVQTVGKLPVRLGELGVDFLTLSGHKFAGPKGIGALVVDKAAEWQPLLLGGGHERGRRSGTEHVAGIVGLAEALRLADREMAASRIRLTGLRTRLEGRLHDLVGGVVIFGEQAVRLPNTIALGVAGLDGPTLVMTLDMMGFCLSSGSACSAGRAGPSHVITAMGVGPELGRSMVRVSLGWNSSEEEVDRFATAYAAAVARLRAMGSPL